MKGQCRRPAERKTDRRTKTEKAEENSQSSLQQPHSVTHPRLLPLGGPYSRPGPESRERREVPEKPKENERTVPGVVQAEMGSKVGDYGVGGPRQISVKGLSSYAGRLREEKREPRGRRCK